MANAPPDLRDAVPLSSAALPTRYGELVIAVLRVGDDPSEHVALVKGPIEPERPVPVQVHAECLIGQALGSLGCECRRRLDEALERLEAADAGIIVYLRPDPRADAVAMSLARCEGGVDAEARARASAIARALGARSFFFADER